MNSINESLSVHFSELNGLKDKKGEELQNADTKQFSHEHGLHDDQYASDK
jgi:hypothetical protein